MTTGRVQKAQEAKRKKEREAEEAAFAKRLEEEKEKAEKEAEEAEWKKAEEATKQAEEAKAAEEKKRAEAEAAEEAKKEEAKVAETKAKAEAKAEREAKRVKKAAEAKKKRQEKAAAEKAAREAEEKALKDAIEQSDEEREAAKAARDRPDPKVNQHLNDLNAAPSDDAAAKENDGTNSPVKKKKKKSKGGAADKATGNKRDRSSNSLLRKGRFSVEKETRPVEPPHDHVFKREILEGNIELPAEDKVGQFQQSLGMLLENLQLLDPTVQVEPRTKGACEPIKEPKGFQGNMTKVGRLVAIGAKAQKCFKDQRDWNNPDGPSRAPVVYFKIAISSDVDPGTLVEGVAVEWMNLGGDRLMVQSFQTFDTVTPLRADMLHNRNHLPTLEREFKEILVETKEMAIGRFELDDEYQHTPVPAVAFRSQVAKVPGQDTSALNQLPNRLKNNRRTLHVQCDKKMEKFLVDLVALAKQYGTIAKYWGKNVHISEVVSYSSPAGDIKRSARYAQYHTNYGASMNLDQLEGVVDVDVAVPVRDPQDPDVVLRHETLRQVLYKHVQMQDGSSVFAEIHQRPSLGAVEVVVPNMAEVETIVLMMNRNLAGYVFHTLKDAGVPEQWTRELLDRSVDHTLIHELPTIEWDPKTRVLTTPAERADAARGQSIENAAWYRDELGIAMGNRPRPANETFVDPASMYKLDEERSVKTIHQRNDDKYQGDKGAARFQVGGGSPKPSETIEVEDVDSDSDASDISLMTSVSKMSKDDLLDWVRRHKEQIEIEQVKGPSPPPNNHADASPIDGGSIDSSSSSDEEEEPIASKAKSASGEAMETGDEE